MSGDYLGLLQAEDPLYGFLVEQALRPDSAPHNPRPVFDVYRMDGASTTFRYYERHRRINLVAKFYGNKWLNGSQTGERELRALLMRREFDNLQFVRSLGLGDPPCRAVRPIAASETINCVLLEEYVPGENLEFFIREALDWGKEWLLHRQLKDVTRFLAELHNRTTTGRPVDDRPALAYLNKVIGELAGWGIISGGEEEGLRRLHDAWAESRCLGGRPEVITHGDITPTNLLWDYEHGLVVIDFERLYPRDRAADLGCLAAELKHLFWYYGHDPWRAEPYIQRCYSDYIERLPGGQEDFDSLTTRGRFYMGCVELRICRNSWLDLGYRRRLIEDATACLRI